MSFSIAYPFLALSMPKYIVRLLPNNLYPPYEADGLTTDYIGGMVYENNVLKYIITEYGKILPNFTRNYNITDHPETSAGQVPGNVRVTFNETDIDNYGTIIQQDTY
jgi:hypothetical protein